MRTMIPDARRALARAVKPERQQADRDHEAVQHTAGPVLLHQHVPRLRQVQDYRRHEEHEQQCAFEADQRGDRDVQVLSENDGYAWRPVRAPQLPAAGGDSLYSEV